MWPLKIAIQHCIAGKKYQLVLKLNNHNQDEALIALKSKKNPEAKTNKISLNANKDDDVYKMIN